MPLFSGIEDIFNRRSAVLTCWVTCITFLVIHVVYLVSFYVFKIYFMFYANLVSVTFYLLMALLIKCNKLRIYSNATFFEINIHMGLAVICLGFGLGFELFFLGTVVMLFGACYFARKNNSNLHPVISSIINLVWVLALYIYVVNKKQPIYTLDNQLICNIFFIFHIIASFLLVGGFMLALVEYSMHLENKNHMASITDQLTGLLNRYGILEKYNIDQKKLTDSYLAIIDIDDFKGINDTYGHNCGDDVLSVISSIANRLFKDDIVARWGGEEFVIVVYDEKTAFDKFEEFRKAIESYVFLYKEDRFQITVTIGVAKNKCYTDLVCWIDDADKELYIGKNSGKNQIVFEK